MADGPADEVGQPFDDADDADDVAAGRTDENDDEQAEKPAPPEDDSIEAVIEYLLRESADA
jgi:hypothetical protein